MSTRKLSITTAGISSRLSFQGTTDTSSWCNDVESCRDMHFQPNCRSVEKPNQSSNQSCHSVPTDRYKLTQNVIMKLTYVYLTHDGNTMLYRFLEIVLLCNCHPAALWQTFDFKRQFRLNSHISYCIHAVASYKSCRTQGSE